MPTTAAILLNLIWQHPANRGRRARAVARAVSWQAYKRTIARPVDMSIYGGMRFRCQPDNDDAGRLIYFGGLPDWDEMRFLACYLRPGDRFVDGGAHTGIYTLLASRLVGPTGHVDAFEAAPEAMQRLAENVRRNELANVTLHSMALSDRTGTVAFAIGRGHGAGNRIGTSDDAAALTVQVATTMLDARLGEEPIAMIKLDIEGAEPLALSGATDHLAACNPPVVQLELVDRFTRRYGWPAERVRDWLRELGYELCTFDADAKRIDWDFDLGSNINVMAVAEDARDHVLDRVASGTVAPLGLA